jgi:hypothetical protein
MKVNAMDSKVVAKNINNLKSAQFDKEVRDNYNQEEIKLKTSGHSQKQLKNDPDFWG